MTTPISIITWFGVVRLGSVRFGMAGKETCQKEYVMTISIVRRRHYPLGCQLFKDRSRTWSLHHQGGYLIVNYHNNGVVAGANYDLSLDDVIEWLGTSSTEIKNMRRCY